MQLIKGDPAVPFAGGISHRSLDGLTTDCGLTKGEGDLVFGDREMHSVWAALCHQCHGPLYPLPHEDSD